MSKISAELQRIKNKRIAFVSPSTCDNSAKVRQVTFEVAKFKSKAYKPHTVRIDSNKGLHEYVKPKFGVNVKRKYYQVYDLK